MGRTYDRLGRFLRPGGDTLEVIASVLTERWRAAARFRATRTFWQAPARWLRADPLPTQTATPHHFTSGGRLIR